jgi:hypothetical protein
VNSRVPVAPQPRLRAPDREAVDSVKTFRFCQNHGYEKLATTDPILDFLWIPSDLGGHTTHPYSGMRLSIRWQRHLEEYLQCARDVQCNILRFDPRTLRGKASCALSSLETVPAEWLQDGQSIELSNGFRVLAVGKIVSRQAARDRNSA